MCCRAGMTRCDTFYQFYCKVMAEWPWWYRSRSLCGTHPLFVPNMDGQTDGMKPIDPDSITQENIDFIYGEIQAVLHNSAFACEALRIENNNSKRTHRKRSKPWWNDDCEIHRKKFNHARRKYANDNSNEMRVWKISQEKLIKDRSTKLSPNLIKILIKSYVFLQSKNPREYWQIINHADGRAAALSKSSCEIFAKHFQDLNTSKHSVEPFDTDNISIKEGSPLNQKW